MHASGRTGAVHAPGWERTAERADLDTPPMAVHARVPNLDRARPKARSGSEAEDITTQPSRRRGVTSELDGAMNAVYCGVTAGVALAIAVDAAARVLAPPGHRRSSAAG